MKRIVLLIVFVIFIFTGCTITKNEYEANENQSTTKVTKEETTTKSILPIAKNYEEIILSVDNKNLLLANYYLYDIDSNGSDELIVYSGSCEADAIYTIYSCCEQGVYKVGELSGSHSSIYGRSDDIGIIWHNGHQGYETIAIVTIKNTEIKLEYIVQDEQIEDDYTHLDSWYTLEKYDFNKSINTETSSLVEYNEKSIVNFANIGNMWKNDSLKITSFGAEETMARYGLLVEGAEYFYHYDYNAYFTVYNGKIVASIEAYSGDINVQYFIDSGWIVKGEPKIQDDGSGTQNFYWETDNGILCLNVVGYSNPSSMGYSPGVYEKARILYAFEIDTSVITNFKNN